MSPRVAQGFPDPFKVPFQGSTGGGVPPPPPPATQDFLNAWISSPLITRTVWIQTMDTEIGSLAILNIFPEFMLVTSAREMVGFFPPLEHGVVLSAPLDDFGSGQVFRNFLNVMQEFRHEFQGIPAHLPAGTLRIILTEGTPEQELRAAFPELTDLEIQQMVGMVLFCSI